MADVAAAIATGAAGEALGSLLVKFMASVHGAMRSPLAPDVDVSAFLLQHSSGEQIIVNDSDLNDIADFINTAEVAAVAQSYVLLKAVRENHEDAERSLEYLRSAFDQQVSDWGRPNPRPWTHSSEVVWQLLIQHLEAIAPQPSAVARVAKAESARLIDSTNRAAGFSLPAAPRYVRATIEATSNPNRVAQLRALCADICRIAGDASDEMHLEHAQERHRFRYEELYIERSLKPRTPANASLADVFRHPIAGVRLVVIGNPGVGKSTLVTRLVNTVATRASKDLAPILVRCRELSADVSAPAIQHVEKAIHGLGLSADRLDVEQLLALGRAFVIFDGVDEVTEIQQRRKLIEKIDLLAQEFPLSSMIATTRKVGYESARFTEGRFPTFELQEYTLSQVTEYVNRWFKLMQRSIKDPAAFLQESAEIDDVRRNPLMLSLLCTLYRLRGYIPMNQRDVYKQCADLLFHSWDAIRHIPQPVDHKRYGHTLMEELADFFYKFPSAGGGVEEKQLTRIIGTYFGDTAGVDPRDAEVRAREFLEFCAGRAWLLTAIGHSERGERLFSFTHRTFMEYYAAEAIVHRAKSQESVLESILEAYKKNPSSVLPDLMFQAYDDKDYRGSEALLRALMRAGKEGRKVAAGKHIPLCLRVLNSTPVGARLVSEVLIQAFDLWRSQNVTTLEDRRAFISLLQLYKDPRNICGRLLTEQGFAEREIAAYLNSQRGYRFGPQESSEAARRRFRQAFASRWARTQISGEGELYSEEWSSIVSTVLQSEEKVLIKSDPYVRTYLAMQGTLSTDKKSPTSFPLVLDCFGAPQLGIFAVGAIKYILGEDISEAETAAATNFHNSLSVRSPTVPYAQAMGLEGAITNLYRRLLRVSIVQGESGSILTEIALWLAFVAAEANPGSVSVFMEELNDHLGSDFLYRCLRRRIAENIDEGVAAEIADAADFSGEELDSIRTLRPPWMGNWITGRKSLIGKPESDAM
ncbi:NACHT domain-containing protein [Micromonospora sp. WMMD754]|uniref:NACHT domain-containing protein n=1 Tax=Micromonospora sp. WMMD754 TaxID=3404114 RepID=UPI003BF569D8